MTNLVKNHEGKPVTTSRLVAQKFKKEHSKVTRAIENLECSNEFINANFGVNYYRDSLNRKQYEYIITRDGFTFLVMGFTGSQAARFKEEYIQAFNYLEKEIKKIQGSQLPDFQNPAAAARAWAEQFEAAEKAKQETALQAAQNAELLAKNEKLKARTAYLDKITGSEGAVDIGQAAKLLKIPSRDKKGAYMGRNQLFAHLRRNGILFQSRNEPRQQFINSGYFILKENTFDIQSGDGEIKTLTTLKVLVTQKGLEWLNGKLNGNLFNALKIAL